MAIFKSFKALTPKKDKVKDIAALPYDVYTKEEAKEYVKTHPLSFLQIDRGETLCKEDIDIHDPKVYKLAGERFLTFIEKGYYEQEKTDNYYLYELKTENVCQTGIVGLVHVDEYEKGIVRKHENTRKVKENDRIHHMEELKAHTGLIFLSSDQEALEKILIEMKEKSIPAFSFVSEEGVRHTGYKIVEEDDKKKIEGVFEEIPTLYICDGHHRAKAAYEMAKTKDSEEWKLFPAVVFPKNHVQILDYNRAITWDERLGEKNLQERLADSFTIKEVIGDIEKPKEVYTFLMRYEEKWWYIKVKEEIKRQIEKERNPVNSLDVAVLHDYVIEPIFHIKDEKKDERIDFIGGIKTIEEIEKRCDTTQEIGFVLTPTKIQQLFLVANNGFLMPPKSTWFEPKLLSGLFIHRIDS